MRYTPKELNLPKDVVLNRRNQRKMDKKTHQLNKLKRLEEIILPKLIIAQNKDSITFKFDVIENIEEKSVCTNLIVKKSKTKTNVELKVNIPHLNHLDWFWYKLKTKQFPIGLMFDLFPDLKEVSESVSALRNVQSYIKIKEIPTTILVIGDGIKPRTASLFAFSSHVQSYIAAIDPLMRMQTKNLPNNLFLYSMKIEDWIYENIDIIQSETECLIVVGVHSHARFDDYMPLLFTHAKAKKIFIFTMKCCGVQQSFTEKQIIDYNLIQMKSNFDWGVFSPTRQCVIWQSIFEMIPSK